MRTVSITASDDEAFANFRDTAHKEVADALGYLTTWAMSTYPQVTIHWNAREQEFTAHYRSVGESPQRTYVIGAIWHSADKRFSFHS